MKSCDHLAVRKRLRSDWLQRGLAEQPKLTFLRSHRDQVPLRISTKMGVKVIVNCESESESGCESESDREM